MDRPVIGVDRLNADDFTVQTPALIGLERPEFTVVLLHTQNAESFSIIRAWSRIAAHVIGPRFAICNVLIEHAVAKAFARVNSDANHPFHPFTSRFPVIIAYRNGYPFALYRGEMVDSKIEAWILGL